MAFVDGKTSAIIYTLIELFVLAFVVIGTPIAQFKPKWGGYQGCLTMWASQPKCGNLSNNAHGISAFGCGQRKNNMTGAAVFAIVSIVVVFVAFLYGVMMFLGCCKGYLLPAILCLFAVATLLVCWACVAGVYNNKMCTSCGNTASTCSYPGKLKDLGFKYGAGFILIVIAWCLQVINCIFVFVLMFL